jgi:hypothetical protein
MFRHHSSALTNTKRAARLQTMITPLQQEQTRNPADDGVQVGGWLRGMCPAAARPTKHFVLLSIFCPCAYSQ